MAQALEEQEKRQQEASVADRGHRGHRGQPCGNQPKANQGMEEA